MLENYHIQIQLDYMADDQSDATQKATELSAILVEAGYSHLATTVLDDDGEVVAEFGL